MSTEIELKDQKVKDLQPFSNKFRLNFKVVEKSEEREITSKNNPQETHRLSDIKVADDSGAIILSAWDDDIDFLEEGDFFALENGYVNVYRGSMRLSRGKFGKFVTIEEQFDVDVSNNRSDETHQINRSYNNRRGSGNYRRNSYDNDRSYNSNNKLRW